MSDLVVIFRTPSPIEADVVRGLLDAHGIPAIVTSDMARTPFPFSLNELRVTVGRRARRPGPAASSKAIARRSGRRRSRRSAPSSSRSSGASATASATAGLLEHALTHRSRVHEDASGGVIDNESLEFLGDSVLGFVIADLLFRAVSGAQRGAEVEAEGVARLGSLAGAAGRAGSAWASS